MHSMHINGLGINISKINMNNIYDKKFELYLIKKGFDLDTISLQECLTQIKIWKSNTENA